MSQSPCIKVCQLDTSGRLCVGCGRTIEEIAAWSTLDEAERQAILRRLEESKTNRHPPA